MCASDSIAYAGAPWLPPLQDEAVVGGAGSGSIGLYAVALALGLRAESVTYVDADDDRRATAASLGAQTLAETPQRLGPFAVTVDSSADADGLALALRSTAPDGVCTSTAIYFGDQPALPLLEMYTKGITFKTRARANARGRCRTCWRWLRRAPWHPSR